ncbi:testis-expressed protein 22 [Orcinus orca]|uniref:testis-expressed protein 22 n=1 Tax=Orcinus orca TaxID=9733 RepID=UPI002111F7C0|nr:testis-expressed protein 22 [Orcinus orca]
MVWASSALAEVPWRRELRPPVAGRRSEAPTRGGDPRGPGVRARTAGGVCEASPSERRGAGTPREPEMKPRAMDTGVEPACVPHLSPTSVPVVYPAPPPLAATSPGSLPLTLAVCPHDPCPATPQRTPHPQTPWSGEGPAAVCCGVFTRGRAGGGRRAWTLGCGPGALRYIGSRRTTVTGGGGRLPSAPCNSPLSSEFLLPRTFPSCKPEAAPRLRPALAASIPCSDSTDLMTLGVRDAGEQAPSRRWNVSIDERWRLAVLGGGERPGLAGATLSYRDLAQIVAQLVSQDEDKGVLLPHPPRSAESSSAFQAFLVRSAPFWHNVTLEAQASRSPPS